MASRLTPCPSCTRHVKVGSATCPFCGCEVPADVPLRAAPGAGPLTRAAIFFAGAAVATACSDQTQSMVSYGVFIDGGSLPDAVPDVGQGSAHYGVFIDAHTLPPEQDAGAAKDAATDSGEPGTRADGGQ